MTGGGGGVIVRGGGKVRKALWMHTLYRLHTEVDTFSFGLVHDILN